MIKRLHLFPDMNRHKPYSHARIRTRLTAVLFIAVVLILSGCVQSRPTAKRGEIFVFSEPSIDAQIMLDGKDTGRKSNAVLKNIKPGSHRVSLKKDNESRPELPFRGEADVTLKAGQKLRVTIQLNIMAVQPRKGRPGAIIAETEGQMAILDFYQAINNKDFQKAYGLLSTVQKKSYGSYKLFLKWWQRINKVSVTGLTVTKVADGSMNEVDVIGLEIIYGPPAAPDRPGSPGPPPTAVQTNRDQPMRRDWAITTIGDPKDPGGIWRIEEIKVAE